MFSGLGSLERASGGRGRPQQGEILAVFGSLFRSTDLEMESQMRQQANEYIFIAEWRLLAKVRGHSRLRLSWRRSFPHQHQRWLARDTGFSFAQRPRFERVASFACSGRTCPGAREGTGALRRGVWSSGGFIQQHLEQKCYGTPAATWNVIQGALSNPFPPEFLEK